MRRSLACFPYDPGWFFIPLGDGEMQRVNGYTLYLLGFAIGILDNRLQFSGSPLSELSYRAQIGDLWLEYMTSEQIVVPLKGSKQRAESLRGFLKEIILEPAKTQPTTNLNDQERAVLVNAIRDFQAVLATELGQLDVYYVSQQRAFDMPTLIERAEAVLSSEVAGLLPDECIVDIREAGKCLAFGFPTAVGFHVFRAVERVVLLYYPTLGIPRPTKPSEKNLGKYIQDLKDNDVDDEITGMLDHLRGHYRNPIMHPEKFYNIDEAVNLFSFAQSAISVMVEDQRNRSSKIETIGPPTTDTEES